MDYSFYGGRRGASFVITGRFASIQDMTNKFSQGSNYSVINYDEYVIIDTVNKNDPDNGKIFRRGYDSQGDLGGAQYVGQIVGPSGLAPQVEMTTIDEVKNMQEQEGFEYRHSEGEYAPTVNLVPGKEGSKFNDSIKWACCSVRDINNKDTTAYVGFTFPYTVIEYTAHSVDPYYHRNNQTANFVNENLVDRVDDKSHPFFEKWNISIPKGIKGDTLKNFRIISASGSDGVSAYTGQDNDRQGKQQSTFDGADRTRKIAVYDYYHYDKDGTGEPVSLYLGDYNMISDVAVDNDGTIRIAYTHNDDSVWRNKFKWINDISITPQGLFTVNYNYGGNSTRYQTTLTWINNVTLDNNGTLKFKYNDGKTPDVTFNNKIQWVTGATLAADGTLTFSYNNGASNTVFSKQLKWISNITLGDDGTLTVNYNNGATPTVFNKKIRWVTNCTFTDQGDFTLTFNDGTPAVKQHIKWVKNLQVNTGSAEGTGNQKLHVQYNDNTNADIGNPLNYIMKMAIDPVTYHLLILHSDPAKRQQIIASGKNATYEGRNDWQDCGSVKSDSGILIGANYTIDHFTDSSIQGISTQLNKELPNGFPASDLDRHGKIVTVGQKDMNKMFFGFDYTKVSGKYVGWYYLGAFAEKPSIVVGQENDPETIKTAATLPVGSVWLILE